MTISELTATPRPEGNQVEVTWKGPDAVRVARRQLAYPDPPFAAGPAAEGSRRPAAEGVIVADSDPAVPALTKLETLPEDRRRVVDTGLRAETVYYYQVFPYSGTPPSYHADPANRVSAMATGPYDFAGLLYRLLPAIYHRYDTVLPAQVLGAAAIEAMDPADLARGQLQRFLELPGKQLDQIYSAVRSLLDLTDLGRVDGRLLPLLAHWIGWRTDHRLDLLRQRAEIRNAPELYRTIGTVAAVEATVLRITGWSSRTKEFIDNVALTNSPERLNLWLVRKDGRSWRRDPDLLSLDDACGGRSAVVTDAAGAVRLCYPTRKAGRHDIWHKVLHATVLHTDTEWAGSEPAVSRPGTDQDPAAAVQSDGVLWLFWSAYDEVAQRWRIDFRTRRADGWSAIRTLRADPDVERRSPAVLVDASGALWLFWLERSGRGWKLRYNCFTGEPWAPTASAAKDFPADNGSDPRVESSVSVLFRPPQPGEPSRGARIWVLWSRQERVPGEPEQTRWRVVSRFKNGTDPSVTDDWSSIAVLPVADTLHHDREPSALVDATGNLTAFWSSTRDGSWSVWQADIDPAAHNWGQPAAVTGPPFSDRAPLAFNLGQEVVLTYRSNRSVIYPSPRYQATTTADRRYSGSTTLRTTNTAQIALRGDYRDFTTYISDCRSDDRRYAREIVGLYLEPKEDDPDPAAGRDRLQRALPEFLPATNRAVLMISTRGRAED